MSSAICFNLDQSKILSSGNGLNYIKVYVKSQKFKNPQQKAFKNIVCQAPVAQLGAWKT